MLETLISTMTVLFPVLTIGCLLAALFAVLPLVRRNPRSDRCPNP
jgi:hypothetical protein